MNSSEKTDLIYPALVKAQSEFTQVKKNLVNNAFARNGKGGGYADVNGIFSMLKPVLFDNGLCVIQPISNGIDRIYDIETRLIHSSGQWLSCTAQFRGAADGLQEIGKAISYMRRYCLVFFVFYHNHNPLYLSTWR